VQLIMQMEVLVRIGNLDGRLVILTDNGALDVARASAGRFEPEPQAIYQRWEEFLGWAADASDAAADGYELDLLGAPAPAPRQSFGIGLNYSDHAAESGFAAPERPSVFTKFPSCITGPFGDIVLPPHGHTDWEVELVVVIGTAARGVTEAAAWKHVAGLTVGQDISERITQLSGAPPQFSMGKSFPRFGPTGPWLVTTDEFASPGDLELACSVNGAEVQKSRTSHMLISVPRLVSRLSAVLPMLPGDIIFTGTPAGVGMGRDPQRWLAPGDELVSYIEGIGEMRHRFVTG
jgi:2-keto-4-pentenoate hydratase/2-oxohepta-3-ene-1,7-dioic acid hydratase in catechol pathway